MRQHGRRSRRVAEDLRGSLTAGSARAGDGLCFGLISRGRVERHASQADPVPPSRSYTVVYGDTLSEVAERHQVPLAEILAQNHLDASGILREGQMLTIASSTEPKTESVPAPKQALRPDLARSPSAARDKDAGWCSTRDAQRYA